jgi:hypothetical protein
MGRIILGDSQQNRASRTLPTAGYEQRRSIMEGGDKWTPNDLVTIAKYAAGAGDYLAPFMAKDKGNTFLNGVTDQIAGGSNPDVSRMVSGMALSDFGQGPEDINSMVSGLALSDFEQAPVTGIKPPMPLIPPAQPNTDMPPLGVPMVPYNQNNTGTWNPNMAAPQPQMMAGGPAMAQAPQPPPPAFPPVMAVPGGAGGTPAPQPAMPSSAPQQSGGGGGGDDPWRVIRLPVPQPTRPNVPNVRPDAGVQRQVADMRASQQQTPGTNLGEQAQRYIGDSQQPQRQQQEPRQEQRQPERMIISDNPSMPELQAARERAMYGSPQDRQDYYEAVMRSDMSDVPPQSFAELVSGSHRTRARQQMLEGLGAPSYKMQQDQAAAALANRDYNFKQQVEGRKASNADRQQVVREGRFVADMKQRDFGNWLDAAKNDREAITSGLSALKMQLELPYVTEEKKADIRLKMGNLEKALSQAMQARASAEASPYRVVTKPGNVNVGLSTSKESDLFWERYDIAAKEAEGLNDAARMIAEGPGDWFKTIGQIPAFDKVMAGALNKTDSVARAKRVVESRLATLAAKLENARKTQPQMYRSIDTSNLINQESFEQLQRELKIKLTPKQMEVLGLKAGQTSGDAPSGSGM